MENLYQKIGFGPFSKTKHGEDQRIIFISTFGLISLITSSDGEMTQEELVLVDQLMKQVMKLDSSKRKFATQVFNETRRTKVSVEELVQAYVKALEDKPKMKEWLLDILVRIAFADKVLEVKEKDFLSKVSQLLGFDNDKLIEIKKRYTNKIADDTAYKLFGLDSTASFKEVEEKYVENLNKYDSERLIEAGFATELSEIAMKRQAEFTNAFLKIKAQK